MPELLECRSSGKAVNRTPFCLFAKDKRGTGDGAVVKAGFGRPRFYNMDPFASDFEWLFINWR